MERNEYLTFLVGNEHFAFNTQNIREILIHQYYTKNCSENNQIAGTLNYLGKTLPVINTSRRLNLKTIAKPSDSTIIVFEAEFFRQKQTIAALVSAVDDIINIDHNDIESDNTDHTMIMGQIMHEYHRLKVINPSEFLSLNGLQPSSGFQYQNSIA